MKFRIIAMTAALTTLTSSFAFAQTGGTAGITDNPNHPAGAVSGPGPGGPSTGITDPNGRNEPGTSGIARSGAGTEPGARDKARPGGEGVNDRPAGN
jgi:hypothetical protein